MDAINNVWLVTLEIMEQVYSVPIDEREALLSKLVAEGKGTHLGTTNKTAPELATDMIKQGVKARSYVAPKKDLTKRHKSDNL